MRIFKLFCLFLVFFFFPLISLPPPPRSYVFDDRFVIRCPNQDKRKNWRRSKVRHTLCSRVQSQTSLSLSIFSVTKNIEFFLVSSLSSSSSVCQLITTGDSCDSLPVLFFPLFFTQKNVHHGAPPSTTYSRNLHTLVRRKKKTASKKITRMRNSNSIFSTLAAVCVSVFTRETISVQKTTHTDGEAIGSWRQSATILSPIKHWTVDNLLNQLFAADWLIS